jgi:Ion channel
MDRLYLEDGTPLINWEGV